MRLVEHGASGKKAVLEQDSKVEENQRSMKSPDSDRLLGHLMDSWESAPGSILLTARAERLRHAGHDVRWHQQRVHADSPYAGERPRLGGPRPFQLVLGRRRVRPLQPQCNLLLSDQGQGVCEELVVPLLPGLTQTLLARRQTLQSQQNRVGTIHHALLRLQNVGLVENHPEVGLSDAAGPAFALLLVRRHHLLRLLNEVQQSGPHHDREQVRTDLI
eukprot:CAMPEP_0116990502 /NCGR_PEP_ID=MMETSP0467-20121206/65520_1 /TAXON_ID=283647 /ORGANISM="Mesodinium pulex, Strain SPMC105" /LENGTH=216 /DNA_ID=CAMNT_0004687285 /DNA_START=1506 /DNA_END=2152 /DNA_ORIENTATION=+